MAPPTDESTRVETTRRLPILQRRSLRWFFGSLVVSVPLGLAGALIHPAFIIGSIGGLGLLASGLAVLLPRSTRDAQAAAPAIGYSAAAPFGHRQRGRSWTRLNTLLDPAMQMIEDASRTTRSSGEDGQNESPPRVHVVEPVDDAKAKLAGGLSVAADTGSGRLSVVRSDSRA